MTAHDTAVRLSLRRKLEEILGMEETDMLLDRPPGGWSELVTKEHLRLELARVESRIDSLAATVDSRSDALHAEFGGLRDSVDSKFGGLRAEFGGLRGEFGGLRDSVDFKFDALRADFGGLRETVESRFSSISSDVSSQIDRAFATQLRWLVGSIIAFAAVLVASSQL